MFPSGFLSQTAHFPAMILYKHTVYQYRLWNNHDNTLREQLPLTANGLPGQEYHPGNLPLP